jgi:RHS repeat-associated protein
LVSYTLDKAGNRTNVTDTVNGNATYTPNALNQYTAVTGSTISNGPEHEISDYQGLHYTYINDEHLNQVSDGTNNYDLYYDALGRCVKRTLNDVDTYYIYDGEKPILEYNPGGGQVGWNVYGKGIDEILQRITYGGANYFFQQDHEGSVTHLTDASGVVIEKYRYDAFGLPTIYSPGGTVRSTTIYDNRFLFTGREYAATYQNTYVPAFTFYEYRARAYNPTLGRFMSEDPKLFDAGDYNLFRYCHNDPIDFTDPTGTQDERREPWYNHQEQAKELDRKYGEMMANAQRAMHDAHGGAIGIGKTGFDTWSALSKAMQSLINDPTHIRVIRSSNDRYGTMLGEMWHTDDHGNFIGGIDTFLANTGPNTPADNPSKGFYSTNGPLPPGSYQVKPKEAWQVKEGDRYGAGWPAITSRGLAPGQVYAPGGQIRGALMIHGYGLSNGCLAVPDYVVRNVFAGMAAGPVYLNLREEGVPHY